MFLDSQKQRNHNELKHSRNEEMMMNIIKRPNAQLREYLKGLKNARVYIPDFVLNTNVCLFSYSGE